MAKQVTVKRAVTYTYQPPKDEVDQVCRAASCPPARSGDKPIQRINAKMTTFGMAATDTLKPL
jgi:hypothetical protein